LQVTSAKKLFNDLGLTLSGAFKDCRRMKRRGLELQDLMNVIRKLQEGQELPPENRDHDLI